jgi:hypothetical protein
MKAYKGLRLYVALGSSQVRRRLKGHGLGVKKVQSAGRSRAVVIHTATGEHLRQLKQLLADVQVTDSDPDLGRRPTDKPEAAKDFTHETPRGPLQPRK